MLRSDWELKLALPMALLLVTGGCLGYGGSSDISLIVWEVDSVPAEADVTPLSNDTVQKSKTLVNTISEVVNSNKSEVVEGLSSSEVRKIRRIVSSLPTYEGSSGETGTYIRAGNTTVIIHFQKQQ
jgi:hypothetical protein